MYSRVKFCAESEFSVYFKLQIQESGQKHDFWVQNMRLEFSRFQKFKKIFLKNELFLRDPHKISEPVASPENWKPTRTLIT